MSKLDAKAKYYSETNIVNDYEHRRFVRGGGRYVLQKEEGCVQELLSMLPSVKNSNALDCPTGTGRFISFLHDAGHNVFAGDISEPMLNLAKSHGAKKYILCSADDVPVDDTSITVWLMSRFCFHFKDPEKFIKEASRVIHKDGGLIVDFYQWTPRTWLPNFLFGGQTFTHDFQTVSIIASNCGFEIKKHFPVFVFPPYIYSLLPMWLTKFIESFFDRVLPSFKSKSYYLLIKK